MKPQLIRPPKEIDTSFRVNGDPHRYFYNPLHFHPELELTYIIQSHGTRFVGDSVENFSAGDMVLVGSNVPHCWKNHSDYFKTDSKLKAIAIVAQFAPDFAGSLFDIPEMKALKKLITLAKRGIKITGKTRDIVANQLKALNQLSGYEKVRQLLDILNSIAHSNDLKLLVNEQWQVKSTPEETERLNSVYQHAMLHFDRHISINEIAEIAHMSDTAFCRYFKKHTRKTFSNFMNEIRIGYACRFLSESDLPVSQVALESGFVNLSNFIRQFNRIKGISPLQYRKKFLAGRLVGY